MIALDDKTFRVSLLTLVLASGAQAQAPASPPADRPAAAPPAQPAPADATPASSVAPAADASAAAAPAATAPAAAPAAPSEAAAPPAEATTDAEASAPVEVEPAPVDERRVIVLPPPPRREPEPPPPPEPLVLGDASGRLEFSLGLELSWLGDEEYDLFSNSDVLPQASLRLGATVWQAGSWSVLAMAAGQYGAAASTARSTPTHLDLGRVLLGGEVRGHVLSGLVGYGRVLAGPAIIASRLTQAQADPLTLMDPAFTVGGAIGVACRLYGSRNGPTRSFRFEMYAEGGYDFVSEVGLVYVAGPDGPQRPEPVDLGALAASGPKLGLGFQGSF